VIEDLYRRADDLVGRILHRLGQEGVLIVLSDHGFNSFARGVNVNSWLWRNGYLGLKDGVGRSGEWFENVDWEHTRAYALGLNGLYINQRGREHGGIVAPGEETRSLKHELQEKLQAFTDPSNGRACITHVRDRDAVYKGPFRENAPDLIIGYAKGYRVGWDSAKGKVSEAVLEDNCKAWSGDHCIDPLLVPGVLFSNRKLGCEDAAIMDVAPSVLSWFGLPAPPQMDGKAWRLL
jgi:predicted AlkP superfamily phosphohydrolase/phosphomutase